MSETTKRVTGEKNSSISHATMRNEDLIPAFMAELGRLAEANGDQATLARLGELGEAISIDADYFDSEESDYDLNEFLFDALNEYAPEGCYFGSHPGDGSDYGFWELDEEMN